MYPSELLTYAEMNSPIGPISILATPKGVRYIFFKFFKHLRPDSLSIISSYRPLALLDPGESMAATQLKEYLEGRRTSFQLNLDTIGTPFQKRVWNALMAIPYGETRSYKDIARYIGCPKGCRAVGQANGANPVPILVPCHRVISAGGGLGGYSGGLEIKKALLRLEGVHIT